MSRFSHISKTSVAFATMCLALITVPSAFADGSLTPYGQKSPALKPAAKTLLPHHGLNLKIRLNAKVVDGTPAAFFATVTKNGEPLQFASAAVVISFDGQGQRFNAEVTKATLGPDNNSKGMPVDFVDLGRQWVRLGTLNSGKAYKLTGLVAVTDRSKPVSLTGAVLAKTPDLKDTMFFCVQLIIRGAYPGMPTATWTEESQINCRQYSVSAT